MEPQDNLSLEVPVDIGEPIIADKDALTALERQGFSNLGPHCLKDLRTIGEHVHGAGTFRIQRGRAMVSQQRLDTIMRALQDEIISISLEKTSKGRVEHMRDLAQTMGYLARSLTDSQRLSIELEGGKPAANPSAFAESTVKSFAPGQVVKPGSTLVLGREIHMHQTKP